MGQNLGYKSCMTDTNITCPRCGAAIPLSEAVSHRLREEIGAEFQQERARLLAGIEDREVKLANERTALARQAAGVQEEVARQLEAERKRLLAEATRQVEDRLAGELKDARTQVEEQRERLKAAQETELELRRRQRELEEAKAGLALEMEKRLGEERGKIAERARQEAADAERLRFAEKEKLITDLQREIQNLKQKAEQGSMQLQGETLELELEQQLRAAFPFDELREVKKGQRGADLCQAVRTHSGFDCGTILWEAKRARHWSADWPEKLKEDQREAKADLAVIVTTCPPQGLRGLGVQDGVWVCEPLFAPALAAALRQGLVGAAIQRVQQAGRADKMAAVYDHVCGVEFRQHVEALVESFLALQEQLAAEQRAFARQWKEREQQLQKAVTHTAMLYGGIQGIAGREALPPIRQLELPE